MKQQQSKFRYGDRAIVFTMDMFVAITVFSIAFVVSLYYVSQTAENKIAQLQMANAASDLLAVMDNNGTLQTLNSNLIEAQETALLSNAYQMRILIQTSNNNTIDVGGIAPEGRLVVTGTRYFVTSSASGQARYWIWARQ